MSGENPIVVLVYLFTSLAGLFWLLGAAAEFMRFRELYRRARQERRP